MFRSLGGNKQLVRISQIIVASMVKKKNGLSREIYTLKIL